MLLAEPKSIRVPDPEPSLLEASQIGPKTSAKKPDQVGPGQSRWIHQLQADDHAIYFLACFFHQRQAQTQFVNT